MADFLSYFGLTWRDIAAAGGVAALNLIILLVSVKTIRALFARTVRRMESTGRDTRHLRLAKNILLGLVYFVCLSSIISQIPGMNTLITSLLAGSGIVAVIVGMASQQAASNIVSGAFILLFKPFKVGDTIRYVANDVTGTVEEIGLRHTVICVEEGRRLVIPNNLLNTNVLENLTGHPVNLEESGQ